jgi:hypothetical protein
MNVNFIYTLRFRIIRKQRHSHLNILSKCHTKGVWYYFSFYYPSSWITNTSKAVTQVTSNSSVNTLTQPRTVSGRNWRQFQLPNLLTKFVPSVTRLTQRTLEVPTHQQRNSAKLEYYTPNLLEPHTRLTVTLAFLQTPLVSTTTTF